MQRKTLPWSVKQACKMIENGTLVFDNPLQRPAGQWKDEDKSLLIDSLVRLFIPDVYVLQGVNSEGKKIYDVLDGLQRLTNIFSFIKDEWTLTTLQPIVLETSDETYNISGKKFSDLPSEVQEAIMSYTITFRGVELDEDDDEESVVEDIFYRLNNGKAVSREHLALVRAGKNVKEFIRKIITEHPLFVNNIAKFSANAIKKSDREMAVLQAIMLISGKDFKSFVAKDVEEFFDNNSISDEVLRRTEQALTDITTVFVKPDKFVKKVNIPILAYVFAHSTNKEETKEKLIDYVDNTKPADKYTIYTGQGSVKIEKVKGRMNALCEICNVVPEEEEEEVSPQGAVEIDYDKDNDSDSNEVAK